MKLSAPFPYGPRRGNLTSDPGVEIFPPVAHIGGGQPLRREFPEEVQVTNEIREFMWDPELEKVIAKLIREQINALAISVQIPASMLRSRDFHAHEYVPERVTYGPGAEIDGPVEEPIRFGPGD